MSEQLTANQRVSLPKVLRGIGESQEVAMLSIAEDGSVIEYFTEAAQCIDEMRQALESIKAAALAKGPDDFSYADTAQRVLQRWKP